MISATGSGRKEILSLYTMFIKRKEFCGRRTEEVVKEGDAKVTVSEFVVLSL